MPSDMLSAAAEPSLDSFVLRFTSDGEGIPCGSGPQAASVASWHGVIRHVQTNRERAFSRWADAVAFICEFVNVQEHGVREQDVQEHRGQEHGGEENQDEC